MHGATLKICVPSLKITCPYSCQRSHASLAQVWKLVSSVLQFSVSILKIKLSTSSILLRYKSEGRGLDSRWCRWNFSLT